MKSSKPRISKAQIHQMLADALGACAFTCIFIGLLMIEAAIHQPFFQAGV